MASPTPVHQTLVAMFTPSHFSFLFCNHVLTPVHPSVFILYKCMVLRLSCLSSHFPYFVIAISHLVTYPNTPTVFPHLVCPPACFLPSLSPTHAHTFVLSFFIYWSFVILLCTNCVCTMRVDNRKPTFWLDPFSA